MGEAWAHEAKAPSDMSASAVGQPLLPPRAAFRIVRCMAQLDRDAVAVAHVSTDGATEAFAVDAIPMNSRILERLAGRSFGHRQDLQHAWQLRIEIDDGAEQFVVRYAPQIPQPANARGSSTNLSPGRFAIEPQ